MKKLIFGLFIILNFLSSAALKTISEIENLSFNVREIGNINGEKKEQRYEIVLEIPGKMKKTMLFPQLNKGETYVYNNGEKIVYLPFFNQVQKGQVSKEENRVLEFINSIIDKERNDKSFASEYYKNRNQEITLSSGEKVIIKEKKKIDDFLLPEKIEIYSGDINIANLELDDIRINRNLGKEEFEIKR